MNRDHLIDLHSNGVHLHCELPKGKWAGKYLGNGSTSCARARQFDRLHGHDYDGPLICGCEKGI